MQLKKIGKIFSFYILASIFFVVNLSADILFTKKEIEYIHNKKVLNVYIKKDWAPFDNLKFDRIEGYLKEYFTLITKRAGLKVSFQDQIKIFNDENIFKDNQIDMIGTLKKSKNLEKKYLYSKNEVYNIYLSLVAPKGNNVSLEKLKGKKLAIVSSCYAIDTLRKKYPDIRLIECETNLDVLKFVLRKKADAAFGNYYVLNYLIDKNFISGLSIKTIGNDKFIKKIPEYIGFDKNDHILKDIIDKVINSIDKEEIFLLKEKWLNPPIKKRVFLTKKERNFLKTHTITVTTTITWPPINTQDKNGKVIGIGVDYWNIITKKAHIKSKFVKAKNFAEVLSNIKNKRYDTNMATSKTLDKQQYSLFSKTYEKFPIAIATLKRKKFIINGVGLEGKKVAVGKNYSTYFLLKSVYPKIDFVFTQDTKEALKLVENKKVFAAVDIEPVLHYQIVNNNFKNIAITGVTGVDFNLQVMIRKDYKILQSIINKAIDTITNEDRINIYKKWMGIHRQNSIDYTIIVKISLAFILIIIIILLAYLRQRNLQKEIKKLNATLEEKIKAAIEKNKKDQLIMMQQSRLAQMGEVVSMIAHQWKQPLNSLGILNSTIVSKYKNGRLTMETMIKFEEKSKKLIQQMSKTIDDFRTFFKPEKKKIKFHIEDTLEHSFELMRPILKHHHIKLSMDMQKKNFKIYGYPNELSQAIINIINNSKDALIEKNNKDKIVMVKLKYINNEAILTIEDNAGGIPNDILPKIFDPYFTTKENKNGAGIGLYMTKIIIEKHMDGKIEATNTKDGAKIKIIIGVINEK